MGIDYPLPDLDGPAMFGKILVHDKQGAVVGAGALKHVGEAFLWLRPDSSPREKITAIRRMSAVMTTTAKLAGVEEVSCWVPTEMEPQFAHMLQSLGWIRSQWPNYTLIL